MEETLQFELRFKTARDFQMQGKFLHALQIYTSLVNEYPEHTEVYFKIAEVCESMGKIEPAVNLIKSLLEDDPSKVLAEY